MSFESLSWVPAETKPQMRAASTQPFCGKRIPLWGRELTGFNLADGSLNELAKLVTLIFIDGSLQILNFGCAFFGRKQRGQRLKFRPSRNNKSAGDRALTGLEAARRTGDLIIFQSMMHLLSSTSPIASM